MREHRVTLADVARELDVATSTVWRALNEPGRLNPATEDSVLALRHRDPAVASRRGGLRRP